MATNFPTSLDSLSNPTATDKQNNPDHATQHANINDGMEAVQVKLGADSSAVTTSHDYKLTPRMITLTDQASVEIDLAKRGIWHLTPEGNRTFTIKDDSETAGQVFVVRVTQDGVGSRLITWFAGISWAGGSAPTLTATADKTDAFVFICTAADTYDGYIVGQNV
jgi:hypothetical protein